jgi:non-ribosomal peptide synthetase component E (peptide arylation enzyme)
MFVTLISGDFQEVIPALLPFYHIYGLLSLAIGSLHQGSKVVTVPKFEPAHFISTVAEYKVNTTAVFKQLFMWWNYEIVRRHL